MDAGQEIRPSISDFSAEFAHRDALKRGQGTISCFGKRMGSGKNGSPLRPVSHGVLRHFLTDFLCRLLFCHEMPHDPNGSAIRVSPRIMNFGLSF